MRCSLKPYNGFDLTQSEIQSPYHGLKSLQDLHSSTTDQTSSHLAHTPSLLPTPAMLASFLFQTWSHLTHYHSWFLSLPFPSPLDIYLVCFLPSFRCLLKCHVIRKIFLIAHIKQYHLPVTFTLYPIYLDLFFCLALIADILHVTCLMSIILRSMSSILFIVAPHHLEQYLAHSK